MTNGTRAELADITIAFLIGAGLGVAAALLLREGPATRRVPALGKRIRRIRSFDRDLQKVLATLRNR